MNVSSSSSMEIQVADILMYPFADIVIFDTLGPKSYNVLSLHIILSLIPCINILQRLLMIMITRMICTLPEIHVFSSLQ